jgi:predicted ATPase
MKIESIEINGYRSVKELRLKLGDVTVLVGPNGCGKSNIYQAIKLGAASARGQLASEIISEGGINSILWAGKLHKHDDPYVRIAIAFEDDLSYELEIGRVPYSDRISMDPGKLLTIFRHDPDVKRELVQIKNGKKKIALLSREGGSITARNMDGRNAQYPGTIDQTESVLSEIREPHKFPELSSLRTEFCSWRFYHTFRTDLDSPIRQPQQATLTNVMSNDGANLASAIATIIAVGHAERLFALIESAFPNSKLVVGEDNGEIALYMNAPGVWRPLSCREFSDGTLQYLCLLAALLTPRPAPFVVLNEPETSIHPSLFKPLAELILDASKHSQILLTTHAKELADLIKKHKNARIVELEKKEGATNVCGSNKLSRYHNENADDEDE